MLASSFRGLWASARPHAALIDAARKLAAVDGWPDGWVCIRKTLHYDKSQLFGESLKALLGLEKELAPRDLVENIRAKVLSDYYFEVDLDDDEAETGVDRYNKAQDSVEALGKLAVQDVNALEDLSPYLFPANSNGKTWRFGVGVGQSAVSTPTILDRIKIYCKESRIEGIGSNFVVGLIVGWDKSDPVAVSNFLDMSLCDDDWVTVLPQLQIAIGLDERACIRLLKCLENDRAPSRQYQYLGYGRATDTLSVEQIASLVVPLANRPDKGLEVAVDVLYMVIHCAKEKGSDYQTELQKFCLKFLATVDWELFSFNNDNVSNHLEKIIEFGLLGEASDSDAMSALDKLSYFRHSGIPYSLPRIGLLLVPFFKAFPKEALDTCYFLNADGDYRSSIRLVSKVFDRLGETAVGAAPEEALIQWCRLSINDRCIFAAQTCTLFEKSSRDASGEVGVVGITSTAKSVLKLAIDKKKVLDIFIDRCSPLSWSGSRAAIMRQRLPLLDQFGLHRDDGLDEYIENTKARFSAIISNCETEEADWEKSRAARFE